LVVSAIAIPLLTYITQGVIVGMYKINYYTRPNGKQPAKDWLFHRLDKILRAGIMAKIQYLEERGLELLGTRMLKPVRGEHGLYELTSGQCRVIVYYDTRKGHEFVLLNGFLKKKRREREKIDEARFLLYEYLSRE